MIDFDSTIAVTYQETNKGELHKYGLVPGWENAQEQGVSLLDHLRLDGECKRAKVFLDGKELKRSMRETIRDRDYFPDQEDDADDTEEEQQTTEPQGRLPDIQTIKMRGKAQGLFGYRKLGREYTVYHLPTGLIFYVTTTRLDVQMVAREISNHCRKGIGSKDSDTVRSALPTNYPRYLVERELGAYYILWDEENGND